MASINARLVELFLGLTVVASLVLPTSNALADWVDFVDETATRLVASPDLGVEDLQENDCHLHPWRAELVLSGRAQQWLVRGFLRQRQQWNAQTTGRLGVLFAECGNLRVGHVIHRPQRNIHGG